MKRRPRRAVNGQGRQPRSGGQRGARGAHAGQFFPRRAQACGQHHFQRCRVGVRLGQCQQRRCWQVVQCGQHGFVEGGCTTGPRSTSTVPSCLCHTSMASGPPWLSVAKPPMSQQRINSQSGLDGGQSAAPNYPAARAIVSSSSSRILATSCDRARAFGLDLGAWARVIKVHR